MNISQLLKLGHAIIEAGGSLDTARTAIFMENTEIEMSTLKQTVLVALVSFKNKMEKAQ